MKLVKFMKGIFTLLLISMFTIIFSVSARAEDINAVVRTGDYGVIWILVAVAALITTVFVTSRLTKHNNKKIK